MGHKVNPIIFRIGPIYTWPSHWFAKKNIYPKLLRQDVELREFLTEQLKDAGLEKIEVERGANNLTLTIHTAKPGFIIGRGGAGVEDLKKKIKQKFGIKENLTLNIQEVDKPALSAAIVARSMVVDLEKRIPFRRVLKSALEKMQKGGALGAKVWVAGRLNGAEIARTEVLSLGKLPLHNLRAQIDYTCQEAQTIYGKLGVKVWIYRGDVFSEKIESRK